MYFLYKSHGFAGVKYGWAISNHQLLSGCTDFKSIGMIEQDISKTTNYITNLRINIHHGSSLGHLSWGRRLSNSIWANRLNSTSIHPRFITAHMFPMLCWVKCQCLLLNSPLFGVEAQLYMDMMEKFQLFAGKNQHLFCQKKIIPTWAIQNTPIIPYPISY